MLSMVDTCEQRLSGTPRRASLGERMIDWSGFIGAGLLAGVLVWWFTPNGLIVTDDTVSYYSIAQHLADGKGLTSAFVPLNSHLPIANQIAALGRIPMTEWPPGYPVFLAIGAKLGLTVATAARAVAIIGAALLAASVTWTARRLLGLSLVASLAVAGLSILSPNVPDVSMGPLGGMAVALAESAYIPLSVLTVTVGISVLRRPSWWRVATVCGLLVVTTLVRSAAPALGVALGAGVLVASAEARWWTPRRRIGAAAAMVATPPIAMAGWGALNAAVWGATSSIRVLQWHSDPMAANQMSRTMTGWFGVSPSAPIWVAMAVAIVGVVAPIVLALTPGLRRRLWPDHPTRQVAAVVCAAAITANTLLVGITRFALDQTTTFDPRHLSTVQPFMYLLLAAVLAGLVERMTVRKSVQRRRLAASGLVAACCLLVALPPLRSLRETRHRLARAATATSPASSLSTLPRNVTFAVSAPSAFWGATGRDSLLLPVRTYLTSGRPNPDYRRGLDQIAQLSRHAPVVVLTDSGSYFDPHGVDATTTYLTQRGGFVSVGPCGQFANALVRPGSSIEQDVRRLCASG